MMTAAQGDAVLISHGDDVVRVNIFEQKTDEAGAIFFRAKETDVFQTRELFVSVSGKFNIVRGNFVTANVVEIIHRGGEADCAGNVRRAGFKSVWWFLPFALEKIDMR